MSLISCYVVMQRVTLLWSCSLPGLRCILLGLISSHLDNSAFALDAIEYARIVNRNVLFCDDFDDFLRNDTASQGTNVV